MLYKWYMFTGSGMCSYVDVDGVRSGHRDLYPREEQDKRRGRSRGILQRLQKQAALLYPENNKCGTNAGIMLGWPRWRWANMKSGLVQCIVFAKLPW